MTNNWRRTGLTGWTATLFMLLAGALVQPAGAFAQTPTTAALHGAVTDEAGEPLADALVMLTAADGGGSVSTTTNRFGVYRFNFLAPGGYNLFVERLGFTPVLVTGVALRPGAAMPLTTELHFSEGVATTVDTVGVARAPGVRFGGGETLAFIGLADAPTPRRAVGDLSRFSARMSADGSVEGLPGLFSAAMLDGASFRPVRHPLSAAGGLAVSPLPMAALGAGEVVTNPVDVEWARAGGGYLAASSRTGAARPTVRARALFGASALSPASAEVTGDESGASILGSVAYSGPVMSDDARASIGVAVRRLETARAAAWPSSEAAARLLDQSTDANDLNRYARAEPAAETGVGAFGSLDWRLNPDHRVGMAVHFGHASEVSVPAALSPFAATTASDLAAAVALQSSFSARVDNELRVSLTRSERESDVAFQTPGTYLSGDALALGGSDRVSRGTETVVTVADALHLAIRRATMKVGVELGRSAHSYQHRTGSGGQYWFGDVDELLAGRGTFVRTEGPAGTVSWGTPRPAGFAQLTVPVGTGLSLLMGARVERESIPHSDVREDTTWLSLTGVSNAAAPDDGWKLSPRAGFSWDVDQAGRWHVAAGAGLYYDRVDPLLLAEWQLDNGTASVRRVVGNTAWPDATIVGGTVLRRLTVLAPGFSPPRTGRISGAVSHALRPGTSLSVAGSVRRTENLPRRTDLNLPPQPAWRDQFGRGVYGDLQQQGGLLVAEPGTGRRFPTYDEVAGILDNGWSEYWGIDLAADHEAGPVAFLGRYSYGQARDNWVGSASGGWSVTLPRGFDGDADWAEGPSDFDVPHRLAAGVQATTAFGLRISGIYRLESGRPFTPGFRAGVDMDGDGVPGNEPAFVNSGVSGMDGLLGEWSCLQASVGRIAARNSCRASATHGLDIGLAMDVFRRNGRSASVLLELFDLLESRHRLTDNALYLVDGDGLFIENPLTREIIVPLVANPDFGSALPQRYTGRMLRLGFALNW